MRQYTRVREECRRQKKAFSYKDIRKVYTIVLMQESTGEFHALPDAYVHRGSTCFDTGLELDMLQEYILIPLDIFGKTVQNRGNSSDGGQEGAKSGVKLACKHGFAPSCTSDGHPMLLVRPMAGQEDVRRLSCYQ